MEEQVNSLMDTNIKDSGFEQNNETGMAFKFIIVVNAPKSLIVIFVTAFRSAQIYLNDTCR